MLIFNTTYKVSSSISNSWLEWIQLHHIPFMLADKQFSRPQIAKIVGSEDEQGVSYSVQFDIADMPTLMNWHKQNATQFQQNFQKAFGNDVQFFSTVLEVIDNE
jgi:hypothetical protein